LEFENSGKTEMDVAWKEGKVGNFARICKL